MARLYHRANVHNLALLNAEAAIALGMLFYWSGMVGLVAEPFKWAMRDGVSISPSLFEYPYMILWATPSMCMLAGWMAIKAQRPEFARIIGGYPSFMLALMLGWYNLAPSHWL